MGRGQPHRLRKRLNEMGIVSPSHPSELEWLWNHAFEVSIIFPNSTILELGTLKTVSALHLVDGIVEAKEHRPDRDIQTKVVSVDNYDDYNKGKDGHSYERNLELLAELGYDTGVTLIRADDEEYLASMPDRSISMISIDSWHAYKKVKALLEIVIPKMIVGGVVSGHDYAFGNRGVVFAVEEWREANKDVLCGFGLWMRNWWTILRYK